jgi:hypothetical protein
MTFINGTCSWVTWWFTTKMLTDKQSVSYCLTLFLDRVIFSALKMEVTHSSEMVVCNKPARRHITEDGILHSHRLENLKTSNLSTSHQFPMAIDTRWHEICTNRNVRNRRVIYCNCTRLSKLEWNFAYFQRNAYQHNIEYIFFRYHWKLN